MPNGQPPLTIGVLICFESAFPDMSRVDTDHGAQLIVYQTSDSTWQASWEWAAGAARRARRAARRRDRPPGRAGGADRRLGRLRRQGTAAGMEGLLIPRCRAGAARPSARVRPHALRPARRLRPVDRGGDRSAGRGDRAATNRPNTFANGSSARPGRHSLGRHPPARPVRRRDGHLPAGRCHERLWARAMAARRPRPAPSSEPCPGEPGQQGNT